MKTPIWEPSAGALAAWLFANRQARPVDLWTITLATGQVLRYSGADIPITIAALGLTWSLGPGLQRSRVTQTIGVAVDTMTVDLYANSTVLVAGRPILEALAKRVFEGATVALWRGFCDDAGAVQGVVGVFYGRVGAVKTYRTQARIEVRSHAELLDVQVPSEVYQPGCKNRLGDTLCGVSLAALAVSGTASAAGEATRRIVTSTTAAVVAKAAGWAALGELTFTSGANAGISRTVRSHTVSGGTATITGIYGWPYPIAAGDAFTLKPGCAKTEAACATFGNLGRFRGEPYIPAAATIT
jgi:uncharacterized phage protein (TIGR02218 family)